MKKCPKNEKEKYYILRLRSLRNKTKKLKKRKKLKFFGENNENIPTGLKKNEK